MALTHKNYDDCGVVFCVWGCGNNYVQTYSIPIDLGPRHPFFCKKILNFAYLSNPTNPIKKRRKEKKMDPRKVHGMIVLTGFLPMYLAAGFGHEFPVYVSKNLSRRILVVIYFTTLFLSSSAYSSTSAKIRLLSLED